MKIYCPHATSFDFQREFYAPLSAVKDHELIFPHLDGSVVRDTKGLIKSCGLVFAEVSYPSTGLGIELGWADIFSVPVVTVHRRDSKPSGSLKIITDAIHGYAALSELPEILGQYIKAAPSSCPP